MTRMLLLVFISVLGVSSVAFGQTAVTGQSAAPALPDASEISGRCSNLPPTNEPVPALTGEGRLVYQRLVLRATAAFNAGQLAEALPAQWLAYLANPLPEAANQLWVILKRTTAQEVAPDQRCALVACVLGRATGAQRAELDAESSRCIVSTQHDLFRLTGETLAAVRADAALHAEILGERNTHDATRPGGPEEVYVSASFHSRIEAALAAYRRQPPLRVVTPHPTRPTPRRSAAGYAVPIGLWAAGGAAVAVGAQQWVTCNDANATLAAANAGQTTTGWPRDIEAAGRNACTAGNLLVPAGAAFLAGGTAAWFLMAPRAPVAVVPAVGPRSAGLTVIGSF